MVAELLPFIGWQLRRWREMAALKNYTTTVSVSQTVSDIHKALADHGARKVMFDYYRRDGSADSRPDVR